MNIAVKTETGSELRKIIRTGLFDGQTAGQAPDHLQGNVVILPLKYASQFSAILFEQPQAMSSYWNVKTRRSCNSISWK